MKKNIFFQYMQTWHYVTHKQISTVKNICTFIIHHISKKYFQFSVVHKSKKKKKIAYTKMYRTQKLINQFLNQVEYPI